MSALAELAAELGTTPDHLRRRLTPSVGPLVPNYLTINPATGLIGANFTGHVHAQGLDLDVAGTSTPPDADQLRWLRADGSVGGFLWCYDDGAITEVRYQPGAASGKVGRQVLGADAGALPLTYQNVQLVFTADPTADLAKVELATNFHNQPAKTFRLLDNAGGSDFVLLKSLTTGAALPAITATNDGTLLVYQGAVGKIWLFRANLATGYWDFVGGPPLTAEVVTLENTTSGTYAALATAGPSITVPLFGDYVVEVSSRANPNTAGVGTFHSYDNGATAASDNDMAAQTPSGTAQHVAKRTRLKANLAANAALVSKYKSGTAGQTVNFQDRWMSVLPTRCK